MSASIAGMSVIVCHTSPSSETCFPFVSVAAAAVFETVAAGPSDASDAAKALASEPRDDARVMVGGSRWSEGRVRLSGIPCNRTVSLLSYASGERRACFGGGGTTFYLDKIIYNLFQNPPRVV